MATSKRLKQFALSTMVLLGLGLALYAPAHALERSDILLDIVSNCVDPAHANYCTLCRVPRNDAACGAALDCKKSTDVWALNDRYTAIRDIKMCGCPSSFVHGLALPTYPVTGVEDPRRPEGLWQFAWDAAIRRIEPAQIALVVNPRLLRSQNQLHIHLLRLLPDIREHLANEMHSNVSSLDSIWATATKLAAAKGLDDYGVLVSQRPQGGFMVLVTASSPESAFTQWRCN